MVDEFMLKSLANEAQELQDYFSARDNIGRDETVQRMLWNNSHAFHLLILYKLEQVLKKLQEHEIENAEKIGHKGN